MKYFSVITIFVALIFQAFGDLAAQNNIALSLIGNSPAGNSAQFVEIPNSDELFGTNVTIEMWVQLPNPIPFLGSETTRTLIAKRRADGGAGFALRFLVHFYGTVVSDGIRTSQQFSSRHLDTPGKWTHLAWTYDGSVSVLYEDGLKSVSNGPGLRLGFPQSPYSLLIGKEGLPEEQRAWFGKIDEVRFWNRALGLEEIRSRMWTKLSGREPGLVGYWNFDQGDARDLTANGNDGIIHGNAPLVASDLFLATPPTLSKGRFVSGQGFEFEMTAEAKVSYTVQRSADLRTWTDAGAISGKEGVVRFLDPTNQGEREWFYRVAMSYSAGP